MSGFEAERDIRLPPVRLRPEYEGLLRFLRGQTTLEAFRLGIRRAVLKDRYLLAYLLGYDTPEHRWDPIHLWMVRKRIPELRAIPGCQSAWFCPRGTFKTAIEEVDLVHSILNAPAKTYGVGSWKLDVAVKITRQVKALLQRGVLYWLFPDILWGNPKKAGGTWTEQELVVQREAATKDATLMAFSLESPPTALHFDRLYLDDVVERRNASTEYLLDKVKETLRDIRSYRTNPESQIEIRGTLWDPDDWYCSVILVDSSWIVERHPAIVEDPAAEEDAAPVPIAGLKPGDPLFPSVKPLDVLKEDERQMTTWHFGCQMLLRVVETEHSAWGRDLVQNYYSLDDLPKRFDAFVFVDLATEKAEDKDPDDTAIVAVAAGPSGPFYNLWILEGRSEPEMAWADAAGYIYDLHEKWGVQVFVEEVSAFQAFEHALLEEGKRRKYLLPHVRLKREPGTGGVVKERIKVCDPFFRERRIKTRNPATVDDERLRAFFQKYERQATRWPKTAHDDVIEMVAEACQRAMPPQIAAQAAEHAGARARVR